jgi:hypothetical protein
MPRVMVMQRRLARCCLHKARSPSSTTRARMRPRVSILLLKIDVTASLKELLRDGLITYTGCEVERRAPFLRLKVDITASSNELFRDGRTPM